MDSLLSTRTGAATAAGARVRARAGTRTGATRVTVAIAAALTSAAPCATGQGVVDPERGARIESVEIDVGGDDAVQADRLADRVRRALATFPGDRYSAERFAATLSVARRATGVAELVHEVEPGPTGGVVLRVRVVPTGGGAPAGPRGALTDAGRADLPVLYDGGGTYVRARLESLAMTYVNRDAWYGRPDLMLAGNPFVQGRPAGAGGTGWLEGFVHAGVYGLVPVAGSTHAYAGLSAIGSGSVGRELFSDLTRSHAGVEDAYVGMVGGSVSADGDRFAWTVSAGRQRFSIGDGFLIVNTATNGRDRAALQSNPRWAADMLATARVSYNAWRAEVFQLDPDELPAIDTRTRIQGVNVEGNPVAGLSVGLTGLRVPRSGYAYYTATEVLGREGLRVADARMRWQPAPPGRDGPFVAAEAAQQSNAGFDMRARAWTGETGYVFARASWSPTISYRYARFSGDDPSTSRFERWDPLLSGGNGETWVQGINHFKVFQNSNLETHRIQARLRPDARLELVPQLWVFRADSTNNIGGNPALSTLPSKDLGTEANLTVRYVVSRRVLLQGHLAATFAGRAVEESLGISSGRWLSGMFFVRVAL
jgi:hypothetical protein